MSNPVSMFLQTVEGFGLPVYGELTDIIWSREKTSGAISVFTVEEERMVGLLGLDIPARGVATSHCFLWVNSLCCSTVSCLEMVSTLFRLVFCYLTLMRGLDGLVVYTLWCLFPWSLVIYKYIYIAFRFIASTQATHNQNVLEHDFFIKRRSGIFFFYVHLLQCRLSHANSLSSFLLGQFLTYFCRIMNVITLWTLTLVFLLWNWNTSKLTHNHCNYHEPL